MYIREWTAGQENRLTRKGEVKSRQRRLRWRRHGILIGRRNECQVNSSVDQRLVCPGEFVPLSGMDSWLRSTGTLFVCLLSINHAWLDTLPFLINRNLLVFFRSSLETVCLGSVKHSREQKREHLWVHWKMMGLKGQREWQARIMKTLN